jgi:hypothetical protein
MRSVYDLNSWFTLPWLHNNVELQGRTGLFFPLNCWALRWSLFKTVSPIALVMWTVEGSPSTVTHLESYCISIRVILLQIKKFAGTVWFRLFQQVWDQIACSKVLDIQRGFELSHFNFVMDWTSWLQVITGTS